MSAKEGWHVLRRIRPFRGASELAFRRVKMLPNSVPRVLAPAMRWLNEHLNNQLYRTGYLLILGSGITAVLGVAFWALAAHSYTPRVVGISSAVISAMTLISGVCTLGLNAVLVRYLPVAGRSTRRLIVQSYALTAGLSLVVGLIAATTSGVWSAKLGFLAHAGWMSGFGLATAATTIFTLQDSVLIGLRSAQWVPLENSLYSLAKLVLLLAFTTLLPVAGPFAAWNAPLPIAILLISRLIFRRLIPARNPEGIFDRSKVAAMVMGNYAGTLFSLVGGLYLPILVANITSAAEAAYFYVPWLISGALQLVALNMATSLTVEASIDMPQLRYLTRRTLAHSMRLVLPLAVVTTIGAPLLLFAFGHNYADAGTPVLRLFAIGLIPNAIVALGVGVARIQHRGGVVVATQGAHAILVVGLSWVLLPAMGITGVAVAWVASQSMLCIVLLGGILRPLWLSERSPAHE
jgi:O-antigen/teichoic acid export membrane protein